MACMVSLIKVILAPYPVVRRRPHRVGFARVCFNNHYKQCFNNHYQRYFFNWSLNMYVSSQCYSIFHSNYYYHMGRIYHACVL